MTTWETVARILESTPWIGLEPPGYSHVVHSPSPSHLQLPVLASEPPSNQTSPAISGIPICPGIRSGPTDPPSEQTVEPISRNLSTFGLPSTNNLHHTLPPLQRLPPLTRIQKSRLRHWLLRVAYGPTFLRALLQEAYPSLGGDPWLFHSLRANPAFFHALVLQELPVYRLSKTPERLRSFGITINFPPRLTRPTEPDSWEQWVEWGESRPSHQTGLSEDWQPPPSNSSPPQVSSKLRLLGLLLLFPALVLLLALPS